MYTCGFRINANLVKEGSFRINAKLVKEELRVNILFYINKFSTIFAIQNKFVGLLIFVHFLYILLLILMAHSLSLYRHLHQVQSRG